MKKFLRLFVATMAMCSFVACGGDDDAKDGGSDGGDSKTVMSDTVWSNNNPVVESVISFGGRDWSMKTAGTTVGSGSYHTCDGGELKLYSRKEALDYTVFTGSVSGSSMTISPGDFGTFTKK